MSAGAFDDGDAVIEMDRLPPRWLDVQDQVIEWLDNITKQMKKLDQLLQKHVLPGFDDEQVKRREEREIEAMTQEITRGFQTCQRAIRRIDNMVKESQQTGSLSRGEETMAQNLKVSLATRVGDSSALFRKKQSAYLKSTFRQLALEEVMSMTDIDHRTTCTRWHEFTPRPCCVTCPEPIHRSLPHGLRNRSQLSTNNSFTDQAKTALYWFTRFDHCSAGARDRRHCARYHRSIQHIPGVTDHGHRSRKHAGPY